MRRQSVLLLAAIAVIFATFRAWRAQNLSFVVVGSAVALAFLVAELIRSRRPGA
jgi:hypothetical protein